MLQSKRLFFAKPSVKDAPRIAEFLNHKDIALMMTGVPHPYSLQDALEFVEKINNSGEDAKYFFQIYDRSTSLLIGAIGIAFRPERSIDGKQHPELGFWLGKPHWGQGIIPEAATALIEHFFKTDTSERLYVSHDISNARSKRVIGKLGFTYIKDYLITSPLRPQKMKSKQYMLSKNNWSTRHGN